MPEERLQKVLAAAGVASRRASESLIAAGRVRVDGRIASVGDQVDAATARIEVDGIPVGVGAARAYVALHKPAGVTSTTRDRHAETTVLDMIPTALVPDGTRLYPVGRLDQDSEGLILLTNDGEWAERVLHPRFGVQREYAVALARPLDHEQARALKAGIRLDEGLATLDAPLRPATAVETRTLEGLLDPPAPPGGEVTWYRAVLAQGWKRQLRRMFAAVGAPIERLVRVRIGSVRLDGLRSGRARLLKAPEIRALGTGVAAPPRRRSPSGPGRPKTGPRPATGRVAGGRAAAGRSTPGRPGGPRRSRQRET
ncbi:MAG TPA: pseudouridine synthase [Candidatus Limnocylindrales bacterium]|nr:pseudouridine synthase [Candidatus Limnocylindrales bacterium]